MKLFVAPIQGNTDAAYRYFHSKIYTGTDYIYTTPFIRLEKGEIRKKDMRDAFSPLNSGLEVWTQIIFKDENELNILADSLIKEGVRTIDINMGCPFPLQTSRGRGGATVSNKECAGSVVRLVESHPDIRFSVKMRLGMTEDEWDSLLESLNAIQLDHLTVHPRIVKDQYRANTLRPDSFRRIHKISKNPIVYNGEINSLESAGKIMEEYPDLQGIMVGRGLLARPSLFAEISEGKEWSHAKRIEKMLEFHNELLNYYRSTLTGGEHQILSKIQPFWEYSEVEIGRKAAKAIKKASSMAKYQTALALIERED